MRQVLRPSALVPHGLVVESIVEEGARTVITVRALDTAGRCPSCSSTTSRIHSRYIRILLDLPLGGRAVRLVVLARRFRCSVAACSQRIFTERFGSDILRPWARRTARVDDLVHHLGLALGGRPAASFARRLMLAVSNDTLLRLVRRRACPPAEAPRIVGIDDWAWRKNQRYGTLICDLERRQVVRLLPDREAATTQAWLAGHPQITVVARDRSGGYALAAARALPDAMQVADRWHLMENASRAFLEAVRQSMRPIRQVMETTTLNPELLTAAERLQYDGYLRREDTNTTILEQATAGMTIREIVRKTGHSRGLVRRVLRGQRSDVFRTRESSLELHLPWLDAQWAAGDRNGAGLWRRLKLLGFRGSERVVGEWATRRRHADKVDLERLRRIPSARTIARLMTTGRDDLTKTQTVTITAIENGVPALVEAREIVAAFHVMIRKKAQASFQPWIARAKESLVSSFANGISQDQAAVRAAITSPWSSGQVEGQITKLKLVKRQMYGRAKLDLLEARLVCST